MEPIEKNYYKQAKLEAVIDQFNEKEEDRQEFREFLLHIEAQREANPPEPDTEKVRWFEELAPCVIEFAKNCMLDLRMEITEEFIGKIRFESCLFELTGFDDLVVRKFWGYLCQRGRLAILHKTDTFTMEFQFDLSKRA